MGEPKRRVREDRRFVSHGYSFLYILLLLIVPGAMDFVLLRDLLRTGVEPCVTLGIILVVAGAVPNVVILLKFLDRYRISDTEVQVSGLLSRRGLEWRAVIEYRDFAHFLQLVPREEARSIRVHFYRNIRRWREFYNALVRKARDFELNMMAVRRGRRFLTFDWSSAAILAFIVLAGAATYALRGVPPYREKVVLVGLLAGAAYVMFSAVGWVLFGGSDRQHVRGWLVFASIYAVFLLFPIIPLLPAAARLGEGHALAVVVGVLAGFLAGSGAISILFHPRGGPVAEERPRRGPAIQTGAK